MRVSPSEWRRHRGRTPAGRYQRVMFVSNEGTMTVRTDNILPLMPSSPPV
jgi:hypothetical protein